MELVLTLAVALVDVALVMWNVSLVKTILHNREQRELRRLRRYRSTKLGRLYRKAVGAKEGEVIPFPNQHYINQTLVA